MHPYKDDVPQRFDTYELRKAEKTREGFLRADAFVSRVGVFSYRDGKGKTRRELRHPDEVSKADSLASLEAAPVTLDHPPEAVTAANAKAYSVGSVGKAEMSGRYIKALVQVTDAAAVDAVVKGKNQLSCGYTCELDWTPGTYNGERYDAVQRDIKYNHVAALALGRAGPEVAIRLDGDDAICIDSNRADDGDSKGKPMIKLTLDGVDYEMTEQAAQAVKRALDAMQAQRDTAKAEADKAKGRADAADAELVKARDAASPQAIAKAVAARVTLAQIASKILGSDFKADGLDDIAVQKAVIVKVQPTAKLDGETNDYVRARFDGAVEAFEAQATATQKGAASIGNVRAAAGAAITNADGAKSKAQAAYERMQARDKGATA